MIVWTWNTFSLEDREMNWILDYENIASYSRLVKLQIAKFFNGLCIRYNISRMSASFAYRLQHNRQHGQSSHVGMLEEKRSLVVNPLFGITILVDYLPSKEGKVVWKRKKKSKLLSAGNLDDLLQSGYVIPKRDIASDCILQNLLSWLHNI